MFHLFPAILIPRLHTTSSNFPTIHPVNFPRFSSNFSSFLQTSMNLIKKNYEVRIEWEIAVVIVLITIFIINRTTALREVIGIGAWEDLYHHYKCVNDSHRIYNGLSNERNYFSNKLVYLWNGKAFNTWSFGENVTHGELQLLLLLA